MSHFLGTIVLELDSISKKKLTEIQSNRNSIKGFSSSSVDFHITLYQAKYNLTDKDNIIQSLHTISYSPIKIPVIGLNKKRSYRGVLLDKNTVITDIQDEIVTICNPYRGNLIKSTYADRSGYSATESHMIDTYGYPFVYEAFIPHITLGTVDYENVDNSLSSFISATSLCAERISIVVIENGHKDIIYL